MFGEEDAGRASPSPGRRVTPRAQKPQGDGLLGVQPSQGTLQLRALPGLGAVSAVGLVALRGEQR